MDSKKVLLILFILNVCYKNTYTYTSTYTHTYMSRNTKYYVIDTNNDLSKLYEDISGYDNILGVYLRLSWEQLEEHQFYYNFSIISDVIYLCNLYNKSLSLSIKTGNSTPLWVKDKCERLNFIVGPHNDICENITLCLPWDDFYINNYIIFMNELYVYLNTNFKYNHNISIIKITGINEKTEELRLPSTNKQIKINNCTLTNDSSLWESANYKEYYILNTFDIFYNNIFSLFKQLNIKLTLEILDNNSFPFNENITMNIIHKYKNLIDYIQWNGLNSVKQANIMNYLYKNNYNISWQTNQFLGLKLGTGCLSDKVYNSVICTNITYNELLNKGNNGHYIELWENNFYEFISL